jgi:hypothetical protein
VRVASRSLYRVSRHASGEPYFGRSGNNRFDDSSYPKADRFGTCYLGLDVKTALAESLLHDEIAVDGQFAIAYADFASRFMVRFEGDDVVLANLTGEALKTLGGDGAISTELPAHMPRRWSRAVHAHPQQVDGILYVSRHLNDRKAVALFDRASKRLRARSCTPLPKVRGMLTALTGLHVSLQYL